MVTCSDSLHLVLRFKRTVMFQRFRMFADERWDCRTCHGSGASYVEAEQTGALVFKFCNQECRMDDVECIYVGRDARPDLVDVVNEERNAFNGVKS
jgi:hypothetical protein